MKPLTLLSIILILLSGCISEETPENVGLSAGDKIPAFSVTLMDGQTISTSVLRGKKVVIEFFNTSCPDCREGLPEVNALYERLKNDPEVLVFAISREENAESIERYWKDNHFTLPYSPQTDRAIYNLFASSGIPRTYIINPDGIISAMFGDNEIPTLQMLLKAIGND